LGVIDGGLMDKTFLLDGKIIRNEKDPVKDKNGAG
jgi:hypothetical protein